MTQGNLHEWFTREVLVHEGALRRFLQFNTFPGEDLLDLLQEVYLRAYESAAKAIPESPKPFLFTIARHLIVDKIRRRSVVQFEFGLQIDDILIDEISPERSLQGVQELTAVAGVFNRLPPQCKNVTWKRLIEGRMQKDIAKELGVGEAMIEKHLAKGVKRMSQVRSKVS